MPSTREGHRRVASLLAATLLTTGALVASAGTGASADGFDALPAPGRLLDTRPGSTTVDGRFAGGGRTAARSTLDLDVAGRAGIPNGTRTVVINLTAVDSSDPGFVTVFPCDTPRPATSNLNHLARDTISGMVVAPLAADGSLCLYTLAAVDLVVDVSGSLPAGSFAAITPARRLMDTRPGYPTVDGRFAGDGHLPAGSQRSLTVAGRGGVSTRPGPVLLNIAAVARQNGFVTAYACDRARPPTANLNFSAGQVIAINTVVEVGSGGSVCLYSSGAADLVVDVMGVFAPGALTMLPTAARLVDTRPGQATVDGERAGVGLRPDQATLRVPVAGRAGIPAAAGAVVLQVAATEPRSAGFVTIHPPASSTPTAANLNFDPGQTINNTAIVPIDANGDVCVHNVAFTHVVVDVLAWLPGPPVAPAAAECPAQRLFPHWRMLALYGNDRASVLGALGEQDPDAAAARLAALAAPWRALSDRPILPTFELIATIATAAPGPSGLYRAPSSDAHVQRYLDAARRHGVYLLLDLQPGRSDFLTEAKRYERFLRQPDVGLALDPEWRTAPPRRPGGGYVGQVDASEVNAVADWLATLVAEEELPEKLLVVHQFQIRMITNKDQLREPAGVALTIHMDGFGTRQQKLATYRYVHVDPPWNNGFKLFFDEDTNRFGAGDVLGGTVQPVPDLITYQ